MGRPHKKKHKSKVPNPALSASLRGQSNVPVSITETAPAKGTIQRAGKRLLNSAIDSALNSIWPIIGGAIWSAAMTALVAIILFFREPESAWLHALLKYALAFMVGFLTFALLLVLLVLVGIRRRRKREQQLSHRYVSTVKGPLDYAAELGPAIKRFQNLLTEIGRETTRLGGRVRRIVTMTKWFSFSPKLRRRAASKQAAAINKHCQKIENAAKALTGAIDELLDVSEGSLTFATPASQGGRLRLIEVKKAIVLMDDHSDRVIETQKTLRDSAKAAHGQVSMDVHTSLNWLIATAEQNIRILENFKTKMALKLVPALDKKLGS